MIHASLNGHLGKDPRERLTKTGKDMTLATLAVDASQSYDDEVKETVWFSLLAFGSQAELLLKHSKGDRICVFGRVTQSRWTTEEEEERVGFSVIVDHILSVQTSAARAKKKEQEENKPKKGRVAMAPGLHVPEMEGDEIPF